MIVLDGQSALSPFRLDRLNARLEAVHRGLRARAAWFVYILDASAITDPRTREELCTILEAHPAAPAPATLWVVPRLGTVSPWSSKASDILRGAGLDLGRVERGVAYHLDALPLAGSPEHAAALAALHDRMTQSVLTNLDQAS